MIKKSIILLLLSISANLLMAQSSADKLIKKGIEYHENGQYEKAIDVYKEALDIEPNSTVIHCEIAYSYMQAKEYKKAIKHCDKVIKKDEEHVMQAYITKGSCLDYLGKTDESIKLFKKGIKKFGDHYLLHYNLAMNYYRIREFENAEESATNAIQSKFNHSSSHLLLGFIMSEQDKNVQSLLSLHYFLLLEPNSRRSETAFNLLQEEFGGNVKKDPNESKTTILLNPESLDSEFSSAGLMIAMLEASNSLEDNKDKPESQLFEENTTSFFVILGELKKKKNKGIWWEFYVDFYYALAQTEHMETYCNFICQYTKKEAEKWLQENDDKTKEMFKWIDAYKMNTNFK